MFDDTWYSPGELMMVVYGQITAPSSSPSGHQTCDQQSVEYKPFNLHDWFWLLLRPQHSRLCSVFSDWFLGSPPWSFTWSNMRISPRVDPRHDLLWDTPLHNTLKHPVSEWVSEAAVKIFQKIGSSRLTLLLQRMTKSFAFSPLLSCFTDLKFTFHEQNIIMNQWMTFLNQAPLF